MGFFMVNYRLCNELNPRYSENISIYSIGSTELALEFGGKLAKVEVGRYSLGAKF